MVVVLAAALAVAAWTGADAPRIATPSAAPSVIGGSSAAVVIDGVPNVGSATSALGSVWVVASTAPDVFSPGELGATVYRIDPETRRVGHVLDSPGLEPVLIEAGDRMWITLADRLVVVDAGGRQQASVPLQLGRSDGLAASDGLVWLTRHDRDRLVAFDAVSSNVAAEVETGAFPVTPLIAFEHVWVPNLIDGTVTIVDVAGERRVRTHFVTDRPKSIFAVPGAPGGNEVWVTNVDGDVFALNASNPQIGAVRQVRTDRSINRVIAIGDRVVLLPTWGTNALVVDLATEVVLAEVPLDSIPVRGVAHDGLVWVVTDGHAETLVAVDPIALEVVRRVDVGANRSNTTGPQAPIVVGREVWVPNRGDGMIVIVGVDA